MLITIMPFFYSLEVDGVATRAAVSELTEIADYTSNTLANLNYLANSTNQANLNLTKQLLYLPLTIQDSFYTLSIISDGVNGLRLTAALRDKPSTSADSWLAPGLKVGDSYFVEVGAEPIFGGCYKNETGSYIWLGDGQN